jgi:hypothetical protein
MARPGACVTLCFVELALFKLLLAAVLEEDGARSAGSEGGCVQRRRLLENRPIVRETLL